MLEGPGSNRPQEELDDEAVALELADRDQTAQRRHERAVEGHEEDELLLLAALASRAPDRAQRLPHATEQDGKQ
jgi:hypothetical protein